MKKIYVYLPLLTSTVLITWLYCNNKNNRNKNGKLISEYMRKFSAGKFVAHCFQFELEFTSSIDFYGGRKTGEPREKPLDQGDNQTLAPLGFEPRPHWWEANCTIPAPPKRKIFSLIIVYNNYVI